MTTINFTSTTISGFLESDFDQIKGAFEDGTYDIVSLSFPTGATITEFSTDGTLGDDSDTAVPTEKAVKSYVDTFGAITSSDFTVKGQLFAATGNGTFTALGIGTNTQVLTADSGEISGIKWSDASGGGAAATFERTYTGNVGTGRLLPVSVPDELVGLDIKEIRLSLLGLPGGQALKVDVRKNGTSSTDSVFTSDVEIEVGTGQGATNGVYQTGCDVSGSTVGTPGTTLDGARDTLSADDILWIYVTQIGSTTAGSDLVVTISVA